MINIDINKENITNKNNWKHLGYFVRFKNPNTNFEEEFVNTLNGNKLHALYNGTLSEEGIEIRITYGK